LLGKLEKERREQKEKKLLDSNQQKNLKDGEKLCRGTMISREQYLVDVSR